MLYSLLLLLIVPLFADDHDHDHDHDGDHSGHAHRDETVPACECITGITTENLDSECAGADFDTKLATLQDYLQENNCAQYCMNYMLMTTDATEEAAFTCYQVFALLVQYHDYCESGTVDEELFHEYLESCPDCYQNHLFIEGAPECDEYLDCEDSDHQIDDVKLVLNNCTTECPTEIIHDNETESCNEVWQHVEGYHRMCAHSQLTEEFDELFDQLAFETTVCTDIHCNVPWEINGTANCSSEYNMRYLMLLREYDTLDVDMIGMSSTGEPGGDPESKGYQLIAKMIGLLSIFAVVFV